MGGPPLIKYIPNIEVFRPAVGRSRLRASFHKIPSIRHGTSFHKRIGNPSRREEEELPAACESENNPVVMTRLASRLGLSDSLAFEDVYSIDDTDLLGVVPRPCYGLILVFPINEAYESYRIKEDESLEDYHGYGEDEQVVWFKQTIGTGCGMIALLHCLANGDCPSFIRPESDLDRLLKQVRPLGPIPRANALCDCDALEEANEWAAVSGESSAPLPNTPMDLHFVCFAKSKANCLWELDGRRRGPINRGDLQAKDDALSKRALELGV
ncbi:ubiquitin carboxyl-terminal hydrolase [Seiridium cupressi]